MTISRLAVVGLLVLVSACSSADQTPNAAPTTGAPATSAAASPTPTAAPAKLRVTDLMTKAGCSTPAVIGTQLYSYETGRCKVDKDAEITVAVFDTDKLRDQWIEAGKGFGGNFAVGTGWAVHSTSPDAATAVATKLGGKTL